MTSCIRGKGIPFVGRGSSNNGIVSFVKKEQHIQPNPAHTISVACNGSFLESFFQEREYYSGRDVYYLKPKQLLTKKQILYYCMVLRHNKYRYSYGRIANKTLTKISIPALEEMPAWVHKIKIPQAPTESPYRSAQVALHDRKWDWYRMGDIFNVKKGFYNKKPMQDTKGAIPFVGATQYNNGVTSFHNLKDIKDEAIFEGGEYITISNDGSVGHAFFQPKPFTCSHSVNLIKIKDVAIKMNPFIAIFLCFIIEKERFRWRYGRKWRYMRMCRSKIKLPVTTEGTPDWAFMESYIKSLPYSKNLEKQRSAPTAENE